MKSGIQSVAFNVVEQVMLDLLRKDVIGEALEAHIVKFFNTVAAAEGGQKGCQPGDRSWRVLQFFGVNRIH